MIKLSREEKKMLLQMDLFQNISESNLDTLLQCIASGLREYEAEELILLAGERTESFGLVLSGSVLIEHINFWGNRMVLNQLEPGEIFAETYVQIPEESLSVDVKAKEQTKVLFLKSNITYTSCQVGCSFHQQLLTNLLFILAKKNLHLNRRMVHSSPKSIRERVLSYLSDQYRMQGCEEFSIPFDRQELADYLNVDRSALSATISKLQKESYIQVKKNHFRLLKKLLC